MVPEGGTVKLVCKARGYPKPHITWRREDYEEIIRKDASGIKERGKKFLLNSLKVINLITELNFK